MLACFCDSRTLQNNAAGNLKHEGVMVERKKRSKAWLHFMKKDDYSARLIFTVNVSKFIIS